MTAREGHQCPVGNCTNWVAFDDEQVCFEHTPPVSPGGCRCEGCQPQIDLMPGWYTPRPRMSRAEQIKAAHRDWSGTGIEPDF